jgi:hypothetical protein
VQLNHVLAVIDGPLKRWQVPHVSDRRQIIPSGYELVLESGLPGFRHQGASPAVANACIGSLADYP